MHKHPTEVIRPESDRVGRTPVREQFLTYVLYGVRGVSLVGIY